MHGKVGENLTVHFDLRGSEAFNESGIGQTLCPDTSVDTLNPKTAELAFAFLTVTILILTRLVDGILSVAGRVWSGIRESLSRVVIRVCDVCEMLVR